MAPDTASEQEALLAKLGPGPVTVAADDDFSGIATYSQVGAQFGFSMLWLILFSFPLMAGILEICALLRRIMGRGLAANLSKPYSKVLVRLLVLLLLMANIINLGADIFAMGTALQLVIGGNVTVYAILFGAVSVLLQIYIPYRKYVHYLKWLTWELFAYVITAFIVHEPWGRALVATVVASISFKPEYLMALVAVLGTTVSPYLFFW